MAADPGLAGQQAESADRQLKYPKPKAFTAEGAKDAEKVRISVVVVHCPEVWPTHR